MKKSKKLLIIFSYLILIFLIIISVIYITNQLYWKKQAVEETKVVEEVKVENDEQVTKKNYSEKMLKVKTLKQENQDVVGTLEIDNTNINYPVLQGKDNDFYMTHNYKKEKSRNGSIFLDKSYNWNINSNNLLIYGHNLNNGTMFQELLKYENEDFYKNHPIILFTTEEEEMSFEIISIFKSKVYNKQDNVFKYYFFINPKNEEEYNYYIKNIKEKSLFNIEKIPKYGTELITLSTCSYHVKDGRFVVVGSKIEN